MGSTSGFGFERAGAEETRFVVEGKRRLFFARRRLRGDFCEAV